MPTATIIVFVNLTSPTAETLSRDLQAAAPALGLRLHALNASTERDLDAAFATLARLQGGAAHVAPITFSIAGPNTRRLAARHAVPAIYRLASSPRPAA